MFSNFCKKLGLDKYIRWKQLSVIEKDEIKEIILNDSFFEDVFEAFCGALEDLIDTKFIVNSGFSIIYNIIVQCRTDTIFAIFPRFCNNGPRQSRILHHSIKYRQNRPRF